MELKIKEEYRLLIPELPKPLYENLKASISKERGNIVPILINQYGIILDGHHRFRACNELHITPKIEVQKLYNRIEEKEFVILLNLNRRHLNDFQKSELGTKLETIESERAKTRMLSGRTLGPNEPRGKTEQIIADRIGVTRSTYHRAKKVIENGSEEIKQKLRDGKSSITSEYKQIDRFQKRDELINQTPKIDLPQGCKLYHGDFQEIAKNIPDNTVDLIFTDPSYRNKDLQLYETLGIIAYRLLKEGGSLVTFVGEYNLPKCLQLILSGGLTYWWRYCVKHTGLHPTMFQRGVFVNWKILAWFVKGNKRVEGLEHCIDDFIESSPSNKVGHDWQQSIVEAEHVINELTVKNQIVLDPFMGSGTTGIAALRLGRRFVGIEIDKVHYSNAAQRLSKFA